MKIAIHYRKGSFSDKWISYCEDNNIPYKIVNAYNSDIINQLDDCDVFMWHYSHVDYKDVLFAKQLLYSLQMSGKKVFPDFNTGWHFDDKVGQKYLLESIGAPLVPSYVFYSKDEALSWIDNVGFPKVFKLRGGAGSTNVRLVRTKKEAIKLTKRAFGRGFSQFNRIGYLKDRIRKYKEGKDSFLGVLKGIGHLFITTEYAKMHHREKGYIYFQEFIPNNLFDIRVVVIGDKAFAIKRLVRKGDFRASGGGDILFDKDLIDERCVKIAFDINKHIKAQSIAYDFVFDKDNNPKVVEISYGFSPSPYDNCKGYWNSNMEWHEAKFNPQGWMIEDMISY